MKISIPLDDNALTLLESDVVDSTILFDPHDPAPSIPAGIRVQYDNKIYQNVNGTLTVIPYVQTDEASYQDGWLIYKDGVITVYYYKSGDFKLQPEDYTTPVQNTGFEAYSWTTRYSKLQGVPANFINNHAVTGGTSYSGMDISPIDGLHGIIVVNNAIRVYTLSEAHNPATAVQTGYYPYTAPYPNSAYLSCTNSTGTRIIGGSGSSNASYYNYVRSFSFSSSYGGTLSITGTKIIEGFGSWVVGDRMVGVEMNTAGTRLYILWKKGTDNTGYWQVFSMSNYDVDTVSYLATYNVQPRAFGSQSFGYMTDHAKFIDSGNKYIMYSSLTGYYQAYVYQLSTPYVIDSSQTLIATRRFDQRVMDSWFDPAGTKWCVQFYSTGTLKTFYYLDTPWDISTALHDTNDYDVMQFNGDLITRWRFKTIDNVSTSYVTVCSKSSGFVYLNTSSTENTSFYFSIDNDSVENKAQLIITPPPTVSSWMIKTLIWRPDGVWVRTWVDAYAQTEVLQYHSYTEVTQPSDIPEFSFIEWNNTYKPFDGKNYSVATADYAFYYVVSGSEKFDTIALGNIKADHITVTFELTPSSPNYNLWLDGIEVASGGNGIVTIIDTDIDSKRDINGNLPVWHTTLIFYSDILMDANSNVKIEVTGGESLELATLLLGLSVDAGFTNLSLQNTYKDFSTFEQDQWGNIDYVDRARVSRYNGTVDMRIENYDITDRFMLSIGKNLVIVNGSDESSHLSDSTAIFAATQKIGRFVSFNQKTVVKDDDLDVMATYSFTLEEIV